MNMSDEEALGVTGIVWEPLSSVDFALVGSVGFLQAIAVGICVHLLWWRRWPPYVTKNVNLVVISVSWRSCLVSYDPRRSTYSEILFRVHRPSAGGVELG